MCKFPLEKLHSLISSSIEAINQTFAERGCFNDPEKLNETCSEVWSRCATDCTLNPNFSKMLHLARERVIILFRKYNQNILHSLRSYADKIGAQILITYKSEMDRFLKGGPIISEMIYGIHSILENKCLLAFDHSFLCKKEKSHYLVWNQVRKQLEKDLSSCFLSYRNQNNGSLKKFMNEVGSEIESIKAKYKEKIPSYEEKLMVSGDLDNLLEMEVKSMILQELTIAPSWKSLKSSVDTEWHDRYVDIMNKNIVVALNEMNKDLIMQTKEWIEENLTPATIMENNFTETIFQSTLHHVLEIHRTRVSSTLCEEFCAQLEHQCKETCVAKLHKIQETIVNFHKSMKAHFRLHGYFFERSTLQEIFQDEQIDLRNGNVPNEVYQLALHASEKLWDSYVEHHATVLVAENMDPKNLNENVVAVYKEEMKEFANGVPMAPDKLRKVHTNLAEKCIEAFEHASEYFHLKGSQLGNSANFKSELDSIFKSTFENLNEEKLAKIKNEIKQTVQMVTSEYKNKMEALLKENVDGVSNQVLQAEHESLAKSLHEKFEMGINGKIEGTVAFLEEQRQYFQSQIQEYWEQTQHANSQNIERKEETELVRRRLGHDFKSLDGSVRRRQQ